jgi:hypothetical protein
MVHFKKCGLFVNQDKFMLVTLYCNITKLIKAQLPKPSYSLFNERQALKKVLKSYLRGFSFSVKSTSNSQLAF